MLSLFVFCPQENEKLVFSNSSGLKSVFKKLRFSWRISWQTRVGKLKLVCVNGIKTVGKHVGKLFLCRPHTPTWVCQHEFANFSFPCEGRFRGSSLLKSFQSFFSLANHLTAACCSPRCCRGFRVRTPRSGTRRRTLKRDSAAKQKHLRAKSRQRRRLACFYTGYELAFNKYLYRLLLDFFPIVIIHDLC